MGITISWQALALLPHQERYCLSHHILGHRLFLPFLAGIMRLAYMPILLAYMPILLLAYMTIMTILLLYLIGNIKFGTVVSRAS